MSYFICLYNMFIIFCNCISTLKMSYAITFDTSQLSSQTIFALLLFLAFFFVSVSLFLLSQAFVVVYIIYLFFHILFIIYLPYTHMICIFLCTICIFTSITTTIPNPTPYYHSNTY